ncbi:TetR family transcriptional regulator [Bifidobacterium psychraerophilum]|jgi:AcrR family transcriptional regulator|uniref:TetR/AcrR family transcriptional regulator n=1 Tax=Bifidobacterium psychraerophilum TaxID=218140 RepID=UPI0023F2EA48|nr:TetR family transcriptional regulator [Bifidobacterium psychraerophilum]MCI1660125.1 TetR family transcriptional regulator [Bifidobacterium psychraerophilum]MCI1804807.1 TetR family transcriptional regulator [Bifidobacterium psychraerophilum]MCI2176953.1 TetR family transcriptional regulator [Bifidobacterium psychraerophilum]MCI2181837.1 TetR family transcriptional regulator [Bifidobacterium psychraerophilum]
MDERVDAEQPKRQGGRRKGATVTREAILKAAIKLFAELGYEGASLRAITRSAGVDVALVRHFFGDKQGLFEEAVLRQGYGSLKLLMHNDYVGTPAHRMLTAYFAMWENEETALTIRALFRTALESEENRNRLVEIISALLKESIHTLANSQEAESGSEKRGSEDHQSEYGVTLRTQLIAAHLLGVGVTRYVLKLKPIAVVPTDELIERLEPVITSYISDPKDGFDIKK